MPAPYQLPAATSREVVLPGPGGADDRRADAFWGVDGRGDRARPGDWRDPPGRPLAQVTHHAAGITLGGRMFVFGGGTAASVPTIQAFSREPRGRWRGGWAGPVRMSRACRRDRSATWSGATTAPPWTRRCSPPPTGGTSGWRWLPVPVRYAGAAAAAGRIWVFGGQTTAGGSAATDVIQRVDPASGAAAVAGHLPQPVAGAAVFSLAGRSTSRRGDRDRDQPDGVPVRPGHVPGERRGGAAGAGRLRGRGGDRGHRVPARRRGRRPPAARGDHVPAGDGGTDGAGRGGVPGWRR